MREPGTGATVAWTLQNAGRSASFGDPGGVYSPAGLASEATIVVLGTTAFARSLQEVSAQADEVRRQAVRAAAKAIGPLGACDLMLPLFAIAPGRTAGRRRSAPWIW